MKKLTTLLLTMAIMLLVWGLFAPSHAQNPADEGEPTFYRLIPGTYVNGWPRFTIHYPKEWVERLPGFPALNIFAVSSPNPVPFPESRVVVYPYLPGRDNPEFVAALFKTLGFTDVTVVNDKLSQLRDGTPIREFEFRMVMNAVPVTQMNLLTRKGDMLVRVEVRTLGEKIGEDLKAILYSLEFQGKDEPVKVPPDVEEFFNKHGNDILSHDVAKVMANYSDRYLNSGVRKGETERMWKQAIGTITSLSGSITDFVAAGDRAYLTGFSIGQWGKAPIIETSIIKENGEWKWYGNQRDVAP